jgi:CDP-2,3-bis-(O-geranylgeranyl)-sn-glycerol synthase
MGMLDLLASALWFILPAYVANATPVVLGGGRSIDGGRKFLDGRPLFGPGKTIRGFFSGLVAGSCVGLVQGLIVGDPLWPIVGFLLSFGALTGDLLGSFAKRRLNIPRGEMAPGLDQLGFLLFALFFASPLVFPSLEMLLTLVVITPPIHLGMNFLGHKFGVKRKPF